MSSVSKGKVIKVAFSLFSCIVFYSIMYLSSKSEIYVTITIIVGAFRHRSALLNLQRNVYNVLVPFKNFW